MYLTRRSLKYNCIENKRLLILILQFFVLILWSLDTFAKLTSNTFLVNQEGKLTSQSASAIASYKQKPVLGRGKMSAWWLCTLYIYIEIDDENEK